MQSIKYKVPHLHKNNQSKNAKLGMNWLSRNTRGNHLLDTVNQNLNGNKEYSAEGQNTSQAGHVSSG